MSAVIHTVAQHALRFGDAPIAFIGDPRHCVGLLQVHNPSERKVKLSRLRLRSTAQVKLGCDASDDIEARMSDPICAFETRQLRVTLQLPPGTPPGRYEAQLEAADGARHPVSIHVLEHRRMRLAPTAITVTRESGATFGVQVSVSNLGNVPVTVPKSAVLEVHEAEYGWTHHFHAAAKAHGDEGHQAFLDAFVKKMASTEPGLGRVKVRDGAGLLEAQQSRLLGLEIALPKKLRSDGKYRAIARLADAMLRLTLHVEEPTQTPSTIG